MKKFKISNADDSGLLRGEVKAVYIYDADACLGAWRHFCKTHGVKYTGEIPHNMSVQEVTHNYINHDDEQPYTELEMAQQDVARLQAELDGIKDEHRSHLKYILSALSEGSFDDAQRITEAKRSIKTRLHNL